MEYKIVFAAYREELERYVRRELTNSWTLQGGPFVVEGIIHQAMVRDNLANTSAGHSRREE